jgi:hypothetical protein
MTRHRDAPASGWLGWFTTVRMLGTLGFSILAATASGAFLAGTHWTGIGDQLTHLSQQGEANRLQVMAALEAAQREGAEKRSAIDARVKTLETRQDRDDQTSRETAAAVARLDGKMDGVQHSMDSVQRSMDSLSAMILSHGRTQQESRAGR